MGAKVRERNEPMYISRITKDKREQLTSLHLEETAKLASKWAKHIGFAQTADIAGLLHDMGKLSKEFLSYLRKQEKSKRGSIIHSTQGAKYIYETMVESDDNKYLFAAEMIGLCIAGHHGSLMDGISPGGEIPYLERILSPDMGKLHFDEVKTEFLKNIHLSSDLEKLFEAANCELQQFIEACRNRNLNTAFMVHMLIKYLFSCLVDADRYDAYCFEANIKFEYDEIPPWGSLSDHLNEFLVTKNKQSNTSIDRIRSDISEKCLAAASRPQGVYQLEVPTGGGKTLSSLRFAFKHAQKHNMERIIYVIPYLSVLEQTSNDMREALDLSINDPLVLEHHSNLIPPDNEEKAEEVKLLTDRWQAPIIITTMVQFLESIFSERSSKLRKLHNMTNAVIIFDEVQSIPIKCVSLFNDAVNFLSNFGKSTALLCTATQPLLDRVEHHICLSSKPNLIADIREDFMVLKRTRIIDNCIRDKYTVEKVTDFILEKQSANGNCLVILNTKHIVSMVYNTLKTRLPELNRTFKLYHLSTLMCPAHRIDIVERLKNDLKSRVPVICISSQLIEAGINISFGCVIRDLAGLDSIAQAAGRCNRHGEDPNGRDVYIVNIADEKLTRLPDIKVGSEITERIIDENYDNLLDKPALERYYDEYFYKRSGEMNYPIGVNGNLYDLLTINQKGSLAYANRMHTNTRQPKIRQAFQTAGENFSVIENNTIGVLVPYSEGATLEEEYRYATLVEKSTLLRKMGRYSVSLYKHQIEKLDKAGALFTLADDILVLDKAYYDSERGIDLKMDPNFLYY